MQNTLFTGDNLYILHGMDSGSVDLIYLDPPFNSKRTYSAPVGTKAAGASFKDMWTWQDVDEGYLETLTASYPFLVNFIQSIEEIHGRAMMAYVTYMTQRLIEMHRVLKDTGSLYLHCDPTASHYLKVVLDRIFGKDNFLNEVVWCYGKWTNTAKHFQKNHDVILAYAKSFSDHVFNKQFNPDAPQKKKYDRGWDSNVVKDGVDKIRQLIVYDRSKAQTKIDSGEYDRVVYRENQQKVALPDWWSIPILNSQSKERLGYPTQKPLALLYRVIEASSNPGDVVFDPFCGCATACVAAQQLGRKWIGIDIEEQAAGILVERLADDSGLFSDFIHRTDIPERTDISKEPVTQSVKERLFEDQKGHCNGCNVELDIRHFEVDHIIPKSKGGGDYYINYQLLCGNCNRTKGDRPMEYLRNKVKVREALLRKNVSYGF